MGSSFLSESNGARVNETWRALARPEKLAWESMMRRPFEHTLKQTDRLACQRWLIDASVFYGCIAPLIVGLGLILMRSYSGYTEAVAARPEMREAATCPFSITSDPPPCGRQTYGAEL